MSSILSSGWLGFNVDKHIVSQEVSEFQQEGIARMLPASTAGIHVWTPALLVVTGKSLRCYNPKRKSVFRNDGVGTFSLNR